MKKMLCLVLALCLIVPLSACGNSSSLNNSDQTNSAEESAASSGSNGRDAENNGNSDNIYELAVVTDANSIDDRGFNQGAWEGLAKYAEENSISHQYYRPIDQSTNGYLVAIEAAVNNGAKLIVCPGYLFETAIYQAQDLYPDVHFIILDGRPQNGDYTDYKTGDNTYSVIFAEDESGFLAGYAAVKEGYTKLGFFGAMAVPAVVRYGYGYLQGAEYAAGELGKEPGSIECKYSYTGTFEILPENQTKAASWFQSGTEVIFGCGNPDNVFAAAESVGDCMSIGVDIDQSESSETVLTSATKQLSAVVYDGIDKLYKGEFPGGTDAIVGVLEDAVGLPMETSRFKVFTQADYDAIYGDMVQDVESIRSDMIKDVDDAGKSVSVSDVAASLTYVNVVIIN